MKKTIDLLNEVIEMGFTREEALQKIDATLDEVFGFENRENLALAEELIEDDLYDDIALGFKCELEGRCGLL